MKKEIDRRQENSQARIKITFVDRFIRPWLINTHGKLVTLLYWIGTDMFDVITSLVTIIDKFTFPPFPDLFCN